jgi:hypothetical protein
MIIFVLLISTLLAQESKTDSIKHLFVCTDYTQGMTCIISYGGKLVWQYPAKQCND